MNKDSKLLAEAYESIHKTWRVYLDKPGSGWEDLKATVKILKKVLAADWNKHRFFYHSSW